MEERPLRFVFAANHTIPLPQIANALVRRLAELPMRSTVLLRESLHEGVAPFEKLAAELCDTLGIRYEWRKPDPGGRASVYNRDVSMVRSADHVVTYFDPATPMQGGTGHIIDRAIEEEVTCEAWAVCPPEAGSSTWSGDLVRIGEVEVDEAV